MLGYNGKVRSDASEGAKTMDVDDRPRVRRRHQVKATGEEAATGDVDEGQQPSVTTASEEDHEQAKETRGGDELWDDVREGEPADPSDSEDEERTGESQEEEETEEEGDDDTSSIHSDSSLMAASLRKISETMAGVAERMSQIESRLEEKMEQIGEKVSELETKLNEKVGELEAHIKQGVEKTRANIERISHRAWTSLPFDKLPKWLQDNEYLTAEHRPPMHSFLGCFKSMFRMHTETWNIWTHFLGVGFFVALCLGIYVYGDYITFLFEDIEVYKLPATEQAMLFCFFLAAMICLSCSTLFHLFSNHSHDVYRIFSRLDYSGIAILITGSSIPAYYYGFYCSDMAKYTHMTIVGVLCVACVVFSLWEKFAAHEYRPLRFATFVSFGVYGVIPTVHVVVKEGIEKQHVIDAGRGLFVMACLYIFGAVLYVVRFPERIFPGKFNTWASSHQLFHICVVCAAVVHYDTLLSMIKYRMSFDSCSMDLASLELPLA